jgi:hypothetical protein
MKSEIKCMRKEVFDRSSDIGNKAVLWHREESRADSMAGINCRIA